MQLESASLLTAPASLVDERAATAIALSHLSSYLPRDVTSPGLPRSFLLLWAARLSEAPLLEDLDQLVQRALDDESDVPASPSTRADRAEQFLRPPKLIP
jgi:hypothetical protein